MVKISDDELLRLVWLNQLRNLAKGVVSKYFGGKFGLVDDTDFWYMAACKTTRCERMRVTSVLSEGQLLQRLRKLGDRGRLKWQKNPEMFWIDSDCSRAAYRAAREYWIVEGLLEPPHKPTLMTAEKYEMLAAECEQLLLAKFSGAELPQATTEAAWAAA